MFTVVVTFSISDELTNYVLEPDCMFFFVCFFGAGGLRGGGWGLVNDNFGLPLIALPSVGHVHSCSNFFNF